MDKKNQDFYMPSDGQEELLMLAGRVNALVSYVRVEKNFVSREVIAALLGFELEKHNKCDMSE